MRSRRRPPLNMLLFLGILASTARPAVLIAAAEPKPAATPQEKPHSTLGDDKTEPFDYEVLNHKLELKSLRAGNHTASGTEKYYFTITMYALLKTPEENQLEFSKRKQLTEMLGEFADTQLNALSYWHPDAQSAKTPPSFVIKGSSIREHVAKAMTEFKAPESDIAVLIQVAMFVKAKKFFFFGKDLQIATADYYPVPLTSLDSSGQKDKELVLSDDKGTKVTIAVIYANHSQEPSGADAKKVH